MAKLSKKIEETKRRTEALNSQNTLFGLAMLSNCSQCNAKNVVLKTNATQCVSIERNKKVKFKAQPILAIVKCLKFEPF